MDYRLSCTCGNHVTVNEAAAGSTVTCSCGRPIDVPSWRELNARSGQPAPALSPELVIQTLLSAGEVPFDNACARCGSKTDELIQVVVECERMEIKGGGFSWLTLILSLIFLPVVIFYRRGRAVSGQDKVYLLPLPVCKQCQGHLRDPIALRHALQKVEVYRQLLEKYPQAKIQLATP